MTRLLIDGDALVYKAGFVSEEAFYFVFKDGIQQGRCKKLADLPDGCEACRVSQASVSVEESFKLLDHMIDKLKQKLNASEVKVFLTDTNILNNNRFKLDSTYKQHRSKLYKPLYYDNLRNYMIHSYGAEVVSGIEADDALGLNQEDNTIIVSHDKDLLMVPGRHYSLTYEAEVTVHDPGRLMLTNKNKLIGLGFSWFCCQLLLGDDADNITGVRGLGPVKTYKLLNDKKDMASMWQVVLDAYEDDRDRLDSNMVLLWMHRNETYGDDVFKWLNIRGIDL